VLSMAGSRWTPGSWPGRSRKTRGRGRRRSPATTSPSPRSNPSTLWAVADPEMAAVIERAHQAAVQDALTLIESYALFTLVKAPDGTSSFGFLRFKQLIEKVLGREIDLIDYGGLKTKLDDDIRREVVI